MHGNFDYSVPKTGPGGRVTGGALSRDTGKNSSRLGQVERQARLVPGPGNYVGHNDWTLNKGSRIGNGVRDPLSKKRVGPDPGAYNIDKADRLRDKRVTGGKWSTAPKRNFLDRVIAETNKRPGPEKYTVKAPEFKSMTLKWTTATTQRKEGTKAAPKTPAPGTYSPNFDIGLDRQAVYTVGKGKDQNFVSRMVRLREGMPAPGLYPMVDLNKLTRGYKVKKLRLERDERAATH